MMDDADQTRRTILYAGGAALLTNALVSPAQSQGAAPAKAAKSDEEGEAKDEPISPVTIALAEYVAKTLDRPLPPEVVAKTKLHVLDTIAAMISGSRLKAGEFAARYVDTLGGKPQATVYGTPIVTSSVNAALANGMAAHGDETDDSHLAGRFHPGCGIVPAALATAELAGRSGNDVLRAVALGYDIGARSIYALGFQQLYTERHSTHSVATTFGAAAAAAAMLRLDPAPGAPRLLDGGAAGLRHSLLGARPRACREGVRLRRHGRAERRHRRHHGRGGPDRRRRLHQRQEEHAHRAGRPGRRAGKARRRARQPLRGDGHLDQEMVRRLAAAIGARCGDGAARGPRRARRKNPPHRRRHAGRPAAHRRQPYHPRHLPAAPRRPDDRGRRRRLRQRARLSPA